MVTDDKQTKKREHHYYNCVEQHGKCLSADTHCHFCDGGLALCVVCRGAEGTLTTECSGRPLSAEEEEEIYVKGTLDFINGGWIHKQHPICKHSCDDTNATTAMAEVMGLPRKCNKCGQIYE